jgi:molybdopterin-guanine dinucleotide biosynthesis protein A
MKVTSIILAGGKNVRLGRNKALETINGQRLIERAVERLKPLSSHILIVTSPEQPPMPLIPDTEVVFDISTGRGPLIGIYSGLLASETEQNIVVACDMPFLNTGLLKYMTEISEGFDAVVPRLDNGMVEPLHAIYSKNCVSKIEDQIKSGNLKVYFLLKSLNVRYIERAESGKLDPKALSFFNINRQADLEVAIALDESQRAKEDGERDKPGH